MKNHKEARKITIIALSAIGICITLNFCCAHIKAPVIQEKVIKDSLNKK